MSRMRPHYRVGRWVAQLLFATLFRGRVFGTNRVPATGGVLLVCNHQSFYDPILSTLALPRECHYMARDTLFDHPRLKRVIEAYNAFPVKRQSADLKSIREALRRLKDGQLITVYPEGTRTADGSISQMQPGFVMLARRAGVPIVPCAIVGAFRAWPRHRKRPGLAPVIVAYGRAIPLEAYTGMDDEAVAATVRGHVVRLHDRWAGHPMLK